MNPTDVSNVGNGVVSGGEAYVYAAYALAWLVMGGYGLSLWLRSLRGGAA